MRRLLVVTSVLVVIAVGEHMAVPGLSLIGGLPGLRTIMSVYWAALAGRRSDDCRRRLCADGATRRLELEGGRRRSRSDRGDLRGGGAHELAPLDLCARDILAWCVLVAAVTAIAVFSSGDQRRGH